jgi:hypothetical protein
MIMNSVRSGREDPMGAYGFPTGNRYPKSILRDASS